MGLVLAKSRTEVQVWLKCMHRGNWMTSNSCVLFFRRIPLMQMATEPITIALTGFMSVWFEQVTRQACSLLFTMSNVTDLLFACFGYKY